MQEAFKAEAKASAPKIMKNCTSLEVHEVRQANKSLREVAKAAAQASAPKSKYTHSQEWVLRQAAKAALKPNAPLAERKVIVTHEEKWSNWLSKKTRRRFGRD